eukprot:g43249.t1
MTSGLDYVELCERPSRGIFAPLRAAAGLAGFALVSLAGWATMGMHRMQTNWQKGSLPKADFGPDGHIIPKENMKNLLVRPMSPGPLQLMSPGLKDGAPLCIFEYGSSVDQAWKASVKRDEAAWVFGATLSGRTGSLAVPTGRPGDVLQGRLLCWDASTFTHKLQEADKRHGYDAAHPSAGAVRRCFVSAVCEDGWGVRAFWFFRAAVTPGLTENALTLHHVHQMTGLVRLPGSKSLSNRVLLLSVLSKGTTKVENLLDSDDVRVFLKAMTTLGINYTTADNQRTVLVQGVQGKIPVKEARLELGNAGTAVRPLTAALATQHGHYIVDGVQRMRERPIQDLVDGLNQLGVDMSCTLGTKCPPVEIHGKGLKGGETSISGKISSQFLSALLMASPLAEGDVTIKIADELVSKPYVKMTIELMAKFGGRVQYMPDVMDQFFVPGGQTYQSPGSYYVEGDASSASYFLAGYFLAGKLNWQARNKANSCRNSSMFARRFLSVCVDFPGAYQISYHTMSMHSHIHASSASYFLAGAAIGGGSITVLGVGSESLQGDKEFAKVLAQMGAQVKYEAAKITVTGGPERAVTRGGRRARLTGVDVDLNAIPDAAMTIAVAALFAEGATTIRGIYNWRVKECDRLAAMAAELTKLGAKVDEGHDYITIHPVEKLHEGVAIETYDDHRMAMCFSLVALGVERVTILDPKCTSKTFPTYFDEFLAVARY